MAVSEIRVGEKYLLDIDAFKKITNNASLYGIALKKFSNIFNGINTIKSISFSPILGFSETKTLRPSEVHGDFYIYFGEEFPFYFYRKELFSIIKKVITHAQEEMEI